MAQAARLNLRLQKELKLLLTDPPPGASFPLLSSSSSSSLTTIDAQIKGPEGTVYSDGLFNAKIQIPERYPFQPPSVTFATPIYHPNIDTGGRICLDILNLPPKGAWQPSLNISTVLTSIGLLLSEPNPDDGLMCEASREFKYNRQAFDQKARSMTEKYARAAASGSVCDSHFQSPANPATPQLEVETSSTESKLQAFEFAAVKPEVRTTIHGLKLDANESVVSQKRLIGTSRKLSLESSLPACDRDAHKEGREVPRDQMEVTGGEKPLKDKGNKCNQNQEKLCGSRRKLSLGALSLSKNKSDIDVELVMANHCPSVEPKKVPVSSSGPFLLLSEKSCKQELHQNQDCVLTDDNLKMGSKRLRQFGNKQSSDSMSTFQMLSEAKDEMVGTPQLPPSESHTNMSFKPVPASSAFDNKRKPHQDMNDGMGNGYHDPNSKRLCLAGKKLSLGFRSSSQSQGNDNKENLAPRISEYNGIGSKHGDDIASHKTLDISRSEENNSNKHPHSLSVSSYPSKSLPKQHQAFRRTENQRHDIDITVATKQKKAEVLATPVESESVIVLDSEDSEEEKSIPAKSKPVLARKRLGKWRVTT